MSNAPSSQGSASPEAWALVSWLVSEAGRQQPMEQLLEALAARLEQTGLVLHRATLSILTLHPLIWVRTLSWQRGQGTQSAVRSREIANQPAFLESPVARMYATREPIRRRLTEPEGLDFPICRDLAQEGATDYLALPMVFSDGRGSYVSYSTKQAAGFSESQAALLAALLPALSLRVELDSAYFASRHLLEVYLGANAAQRVLGGSFQRGTGTRIRAAIWYCDLRGFTGLSDTRPPLEVVRALDGYFDCVAGAIDAQGGEVLKFIGDAVLAIFPVEGEGEAEACRRAVTAAREGIAAVHRMNAGTDPAGIFLDLGVAVHVGEVMYGNVGASSRLDFTVIGAAVNEACRLEELCKQLETPLVISDAVARHCEPTGLAPLGSHLLKGVRAPQAVYTLACYRHAAA